MVLQPQQHTAFLRGRQALFQTVDDPAVSVLVGIPFFRRFHSPVLHQFIKVATGSPGTRIDPHGRDPKLVCQLDTVNRVIDILLSQGRVGRQETLVGREAAQVQSIDKGTTFQSLQDTHCLR